MNIHSRVTEVTVCALPEDNINHGAYAITVQWRGGETYAVCRFRHCLSVHGEWDFESRPSDRDDGWLADHRFSYDEAMRRAAEEAPKVVVNGHTVADALAAKADR